MRPFTSTISIDEARARGCEPASVRSHATERVPLADAAGRVAAADVAATICSCRRSHARRWTDTPSSPPTRPARRGKRPSASGSSNGFSPDRRRRVAHRRRHLRGDRHRRAAARRRGRRGHGRGDGARRRRRHVRRFAPRRPPARTSAAAARTSRPAISWFDEGDLLNPSRIGALAAIGCADVDVFARPRVAMLSTGNEVIEPGAPLAAGQIYDVNRFTLSAVIAAHGGIAGAAPAGARHARRARRRRSTPARARTSIDLFRRQLGRRARSDRRSRRAARRDDLSRHRGQAGQADRIRASWTARRSSACRATRPRACRTPTSCWCRFCARPRGCRSTRPARCSRRSAGASCRRPDGISSIRCVCRTASRFPAFKGSGDITSLSQADGYIEIPADQSIVEEGTTVTVTLF